MVFQLNSIHLLIKKDALHFIANLMSEEEAVGEVSVRCVYTLNLIISDTLTK